MVLLLFLLFFFFFFFSLLWWLSLGVACCSCPWRQLTFCHILCLNDTFSQLGWCGACHQVATADSWLAFFPCRAKKVGACSLPMLTSDLEDPG